MKNSLVIKMHCLQELAYFDPQMFQNACEPLPYPVVKFSRVPPGLRSGTSVLRPGTSNLRSGTPILRSGTYNLRTGSSDLRPGTCIVRPATQITRFATLKRNP